MSACPGLSSSSLTIGGGGGGGVPKILSSTHFPRLTGEVRVGLEVTVRIDACVKTPPRWSPGSEILWKSSPSTLSMP